MNKSNLKPPTDLGPLYPQDDIVMDWKVYLIAGVIVVITLAWLGQWLVDRLGI